MKVWLVNPFDPLPSQDRLRYSFLVGALADAGHKVTWWTSRFAHWGKRYISQAEIQHENRCLAPHGGLIATWTTPYRRNVGFGRIVNHVTWAYTFYREASRSNECPDVIFFSSTPLVASKLVLKLAKKMGAIAIMDVVDLWPEAFEIALPAGLRGLGKILFAPLLALENRNFQRANAITAVSETYRMHALERAMLKPSMIVPYGIDLGSWPEKDSEVVRSPGKVRVCYAGTFGTHHDVETLIRAAKILQSESHVEFILAGDGPHRAKLEALAKSLQVINVSFTGWIPVAHLRKLLMTCDIGIIAVSKGSTISFPLKTYEYLAAGVALIHSVPGELEHIVTNRRLGGRYLGGDPYSLATAIRELASDRHMLREMGKRGHALIQTEFDRAVIHNRLISFMVSLHMSHPLTLRA